MSGKISLHNMVFYGYHGAYEHEKLYGQRFHCDVELSTDITKPSCSDQLTDAIDYTKIYDSIKHIFENEKFNLLEALGGSIADILLSSYPVSRVVVRIRKPACPLPGAIDYVQLEVTREAKE